MYDQLKMLVCELHWIANRIEKLVGEGNLSRDLRNLADRLNVLVDPINKCTNQRKK